MPMDTEWAKDGVENKLYIVQARPETVQSQKNMNILEDYVLEEKAKPVVIGHSVGDRIGQGPAHIIKDVKNIKEFRQGQVLVTDMTDPDWEPAMKMAAAIVTNRGGRTCFAGETKILTNKGFVNIKDLLGNHDDVYVPSLNRKTLKIEWKPVIASMKRKAKVIEVSVSQTGRMKNNCLRLTAEHKMLTYENRELADKEIQEILKDNGMLNIAQRIPRLDESSERDRKLAYLLGAISTDGHIYLTNRHGEVQFIQKPTREKEEFICAVNNYMGDVFNKNASISEKKQSSCIIRGKEAKASANAYRFYGKQIAAELLKQKQELVTSLLFADEEFILNFLAGVIDGDGSYNHESNRINIYCSNEHLLQAVLAGSLRLGIVPQITTNRNIYNIQIVEKQELLLKYTKRVKGQNQRICHGTRFFSARALLKTDEDINVKGKIMPYIDSNLLIDSEKIRERVIPLASEKLRNEIQLILDSDTRMQRVNFVRELGQEYVYNITVEDNHNYIVFTDRYTPILVNNCHAAIVSRELGIPCVVGTNNATQKIKDKQDITVSCAEGEEGYVYDRLLKFRIDKIDLQAIGRTKTKIMMNVGNPDQAFNLSFIPNQGVGLAREEFIINSYVKVHPRALLEPDRITDGKIKKIIDRITFNYEDKLQFYIDELARGIATIAAAFYPKDVIVRMSDFKSNEYANLIGGKYFEPQEDNPMIGFRGASRYYSKEFRDSFALECRALKIVRDEMGLVNVKAMIPFCRTVDEGKKVLQVMQENGLTRGENGLQVYVMCEIPSNVILADEFSQIFDGFSIGTNDLTQLTLGLDRDSELVAHIYDERNEAVKKMVRTVIERAKANNRKIGICGDAPSTYPEFARFLVECGIDSISLSPDAVIKTTIAIAEEEKKLGITPDA
jgi:pyruvate,water dikinase